jgi:hypothetical protein
MQPLTPPGVRATPANRLGLDYRREAARLGPPPVPIVDIHAHVNGPGASAIFRDCMDLFGVRCVVSQTRREDAPAVRGVLGDRVRFVAIPRYDLSPRSEAIGAHFLEEIRWWHGEFGARLVKLWAAPRLMDLLSGPGERELAWLDSRPRRAAVELAHRLGMMVMVHVGDPDTWFATRYADRAAYGAKADHSTGCWSGTLDWCWTRRPPSGSCGRFPGTRPGGLSASWTAGAAASSSGATS